MQQSVASDTGASHEGLERRLGLFDSTMIVAGSMIGSGIFIVSAEMSAGIGSTGLAAGFLGDYRSAHHRRRAFLR